MTVNWDTDLRDTINKIFIQEDLEFRMEPTNSDHNYGQIYDRLILRQSLRSLRYRIFVMRIGTMLKNFSKPIFCFNPLNSAVAPSLIGHHIQTKMIVITLSVELGGKRE